MKLYTMLLTLELMLISCPHAACPAYSGAGVGGGCERLVTLRSSITATGTIEHIAHEKDGDLHIRLRLDSIQPYCDTTLTNARNASGQHGCLVVEITPEHPLPRPAIGAHVKITGAWVLDKHHGWLEIHPALQIGEIK
jgi:hypothetical protein